MDRLGLSASPMQVAAGAYNNTVYEVHAELIENLLDVEEVDAAVPGVH